MKGGRSASKEFIFLRGIKVLLWEWKVKNEELYDYKKLKTFYTIYFKVLRLKTIQGSQEGNITMWLTQGQSKMKPANL